MGRKIFLTTLALAFLYLVSSLLLPVVMGGILAVVFLPLMHRLTERKVPPRAVAGFLTIGVTVVILIPISFLIFAGIKSGMQQVQALKDAPKGDGGIVGAFMHHPAIARLTETLSGWFPVSAEELAGNLRDLAESTGKKAAEILGGLLSALPGMALQLVLTVVSLFFFLADGWRLAGFIRANSFYSKADTERLFSTFSAACRSVVVASVISAAAQAVIELLAVWITGIPNAPLIGLIVFVSAFIPVVGSAPLTFGVAIHSLLFGHGARGIALLIVAVTVSGVDNVVRALFLKGSANLHPMIAFIVARGGLAAMGFPGVFIGPIVAVVFLATLSLETKHPAI